MNDDGFKQVLSKRDQAAQSFARKQTLEVERPVGIVTTRAVPNAIDPMTAPIEGAFNNRRSGLSGMTVGGEAVHQHGLDRPHQKPADGAPGRNRSLSNASWDALNARHDYIGKP
jgi:hypothetical protein